MSVDGKPRTVKDINAQRRIRTRERANHGQRYRFARGISIPSGIGSSKLFTGPEVSSVLADLGLGDYPQRLTLR